MDSNSKYTTKEWFFGKWYLFCKIPSLELMNKQFNKFIFPFKRLHSTKNDK